MQDPESQWIEGFVIDIREQEVIQEKKIRAFTLFRLKFIIEISILNLMNGYQNEVIVYVHFQKQIYNKFPQQQQQQQLQHQII